MNWIKLEGTRRPTWRAEGNLGIWTIERLDGPVYEVHCKGNGRGWLRPDGSIYYQTGLRREAHERTLRAAKAVAEWRDDISRVTPV